MRRGGVAESYLDPLAVQWQSMRPKGWKRFLVFTELTKSRKGADYVALFTYFQFKSAVRIIFAEAGRQVVNAITLYSVMEANFIPTGKHAAQGGTSPVVQFFLNIKELYIEDKQQAIVLLSMLFTLVIFVFSALSLLVAILFFITFLWHYIPQHDGRLSIYCKRKIDKRLEKIVEAKVKAALEDQERKRKKQEARDARKQEKSDQKPKLRQQPTLPVLGDLADENDAFPLVRQESTSTLPPYSSRTPSRDDIRQPPAALTRQPTLPSVGFPQERPSMPYRSDTEASAMSKYSYASNAPLLSNADDMGYSPSRSESPDSYMAPSQLRQMPSSSSFRSIGPSNTQSSLASQQSYGPISAMRPPTRTNTAYSLDRAQGQISRSRSNTPMGDRSGYDQSRSCAPAGGPNSFAPSRSMTPLSNPGGLRHSPPGIVRSNTAPILDSETSSLSHSGSIRPPRRVLAPPLRSFTPVSTITERSEKSTLGPNRFGTPVSAYSASVYSQPSRFDNSRSNSVRPSAPAQRPYLAFNPGNIRSNTAPPSMPGAYNDLLDDY